VDVDVDGDFCNHRHYQVAQSATSPSFKLNDDGGSGIHLPPFAKRRQTKVGRVCGNCQRVWKEGTGSTCDTLFSFYLIIIPNHLGLLL